MDRRVVRAAAARHDSARSERPALRLVDTVFALAKQVGSLLHATNRRSAGIVDSHVVAVCLPFGGGLVVTSDPDDIEALAAAAPAARIRTFVI